VSDHLAERRYAPLAADEQTIRVIETALAALRPTAVAEATATNPWRFSGRWWASPLPLRRRRPQR
jgi:hypothetical protein